MLIPPAFTEDTLVANRPSNRLISVPTRTMMARPPLDAYGNIRQEHESNLHRPAEPTPTEDYVARFPFCTLPGSAHSRRRLARNPVEKPLAGGFQRSLRAPRTHPGRAQRANARPMPDSDCRFAGRTVSYYNREV